MKIENRVGEKSKNNQGLEMEIIEYRKHNDITVMFPDGTKRITSYKQFKLGTVKNLYFPDVCGVGFIGEEYSNKCNEKVYKIWQHMISRCYNKNDNRYRFYGAIGTKVCEDWYNFSNFAKWYYDNSYTINEPLSVDKDILRKNDKIYSPDTCIIIPRKLNQMFTKTDSCGIEKICVFQRENGKYRARVSNVNIGTYDTKEEATIAYRKAYKEKWKNIVTEYKDKIPYNIFESLINAV
jgi:hypothetical protein